MNKLGRNDPCPCGSGKKYKHCCQRREESATSDRSPDPAWAIQVAREHHQAGRLQEAEDAYRQVLQAHPNHPDALHLLGVMALQVGSPETAVELIERALRSRRSDPSYHCNLGLAYKALGRSDRAIDCYRKALAIDADHAEAHFNLGSALIDQGKTSEAIACYRRALAIAPDNADACNNLGISLASGGQLDEAITWWRRAIAIAPGYAVAHYNLGGALTGKGALDEAIACYRQATALKPDYVEAYNNLANTFVLQGKLEQAVACYRQALALKPDFVPAHNDLGDALRKCGRMDEAAESLRAALALEPRLAQAHNNLGIVLQEMGELEPASASLRQALAINPQYPEALFNLHTLLLDPDDLGPCIACLEKAVALKPDDHEFRFSLGLVLDYSGASDAAAPHLESSAKGSALHRAKLDAWRHIRSAQAKLPRITGSPIEAFRLGLAAARNDGLVLEFGVRFGTSIRQIAALAHQEVHGFDSFEGLPEVWHHEPRGSYTTGGFIPAVPANVILHRGWFEETLPAFVEKYPAPVRFMNIDCDIYSATKTVLEVLTGRIVPGTVIVFDEFIGYEQWREDEFRAFQEALAANRWSFEYLCFSFATKQVVVRIL